MRDQVIHVRLDREVLGFIDMLVKLGVFSSRSEALRELIKAGMKEFELVNNVVKAVEKLFELETREGDIPIKLNGASKQLLEERKIKAN